MKSRERIFLIGFSGSGKSTVGKALARKLRTRLYDTDDMIARKAGMSISEIFDRWGETRFRRLEQETIEKLANRGPKRMVVALGGGAFESGRNRKLLLERATVTYLSCSQRELYHRLRGMTDRPLLMRKSQKNAADALKARIKRLVGQRTSNYQTADIIVSTTSRTVSETVREINRKIKRFYADSKS